MSALPDLRFHQWLWQEGDVRELRALGKFNKSGYFDSPEGLAVTASQLSADPTIQGVYVSLNPVIPELLGRAARRVQQAKRGEATRDDQIVERRIMLVDCDPVRPSGINSTDEQHLQALELADTIRHELGALGWPEPAMVDTGNGAALWYAIDLPTQDSELVHRCLQALDHRYSNDQIKIDLRVANASRIARLPGTLNRKGDNLPDRPQRRCHYKSVPPKRVPVPTELLEALAATLPAPETPPDPGQGGRDSAAWLDRWVAKHGQKLGLEGPQPWKTSGRCWVMPVCPWNPEHTDSAAYLGQLSENGAYAAGCQHNGCHDKDWYALRDVVEPGWRDRGDYALTELGNARMLIDHHGTRLRYLQSTKEWLVYEGGVWTYDTCKAGDLANKIAEHRLDLAEDKEQRKWAYKSQASSVRNGTLAQAATIAGVAIQPDQLDRDPWLLNFRNGTLDLRTGQLREHDPADLLTRCLDMEYRPEATCELWLEFLKTIMDEDEEMVAFLQRALGYSLTGSTQEQKIFLLHGHGSNGKSTLIEVWLDLLGEYARKADTETFLQGKKNSIREDLLDLQGARLVAVTEINEGRRLDEALVKEFSGGDRISTRGLYKDRVNIRIEGKLWIAANEKPEIRTGGYGMWRRMVYIPFNVIIPEEKRDPGLPYKLLLEGAGIVAWAVRGCRAWQDQGLRPPEAVILGTKAYEEEQDVLAEWIEACCVLGAAFKSTASDLFASYTANAGDEALTRTTFFKRLAKRAGLSMRKGTRGVREWCGIGLISGGSGGTVAGASGATEPHSDTRSGGSGGTKQLFKHDACTHAHTCAQQHGKSPATPATPATPAKRQTAREACKDCGLPLTQPSGGTGLCANCLPRRTH